MNISSWTGRALFGCVYKRLTRKILIYKIMKIVRAEKAKNEQWAQKSEIEFL